VTLPISSDRPVILRPRNAAFHLDGRLGNAASCSLFGRWIRTVPGAGWFVYFRIYGPADVVAPFAAQRG